MPILRHPVCHGTNGQSRQGWERGGEREREEEEEEEEEEEFVRIHRARCQTDSASLYTLAVRRRELRFKNHHPDPRTSRYAA